MNAFNPAFVGSEGKEFGLSLDLIGNISNSPKTKGYLFYSGETKKKIDSWVFSNYKQNFHRQEKNFISNRC